MSHKIRLEACKKKAGATRAINGLEPSQNWNWSMTHSIAASMPRIRRYTYFPTSACCSCHFPWTSLGFTYLVLRSHGQSATVASAATQNYTLHRYGSSSARLKLCASLGFPNTTSASYISHHIVLLENTKIHMMSFMSISFYLSDCQ